MDTAEALLNIGISLNDLTTDQLNNLDNEGFFIVPNVFSEAEVREMHSEVDRIQKIEGPLGGHEVDIEPGTPRLTNLFNKSDAFDRCLSCKPSLAAALYLLNEFKTFSLNGRFPIKGAGEQVLHSDFPRTNPTDWRGVNNMIMLDDMNLDNGPIRVVPGSHKWVSLNVPDTNLADLKVFKITEEERKTMPLDSMAPHPKEVKLTGKAGSVAVINAHIWHGGTRNLSGDPRRVLHFALGRRDLPQQLIERDHLTPELLERTSSSQRFLLDIEGASPKVFGYPPIPSEARVRNWEEGKVVNNY